MSKTTKVEEDQAKIYVSPKTIWWQFELLNRLLLIAPVYWIGLKVSSSAPQNSSSILIKYEASLDVGVVHLVNNVQ